MRIEETILHHIVNNESYMRKVIPFLKPEYFEDLSERNVFTQINEFITEYNSLPSKEALLISLENQKGLSEETYRLSKSIIEKLKDSPEKVSEEWLCDQTEKFCQDRSIYLAVSESINILNNKNKNMTKDSIPEILKDALSVSFDVNIGHDFLEDVDLRYDSYHRVEEKVPFDIQILNDITRGGLSKKTLSILLAGPHVGKSLIMCHCAAANLMLGKNVLYITLEMSQEKIAERIDANLMDTTLDELDKLPRDVYDKKIDRLRKRTIGKMIIKEFPTASVHVGHFRNLLNELYLKKNFVPDIIYVDYLNLCLSARYKMGGSINSYSYVKAIAEELRGLAVERNLPIVSATQVNRTGFVSSDVGMEDTSESFALPAIADFMLAIIVSDELKELNQYMFKQLKNRLHDINYMTKFVVGVNRGKMKLFDVNQEEEGEDKPVMDNTSYGEREREDSQMQWSTKKMGRKDFSGFKT